MILPEPWVQPGPANNEIWYTSTDGNIVTPYNTSALPSIVSNTYSDSNGIIKFSKSVTSIGLNAFKNCSSLASVTIPNSVTSIGAYSFQYCSSLTNISYTGTIAQYKAITKGEGWNFNVPATVVHCKDGYAPI